MLTELSLKNIISSVNKVDFWACSPYKWDKKDGKIVIVDTRTRKYLWYLNILAQSSYELYVIIQCVFTLFDENSSTQSQVYMQYISVVYMIPVIVHASIVFRLEEIAEFVAQFIQFFQDYSGSQKYC